MFGLGLPFLSYFRRQIGLRGESPNSAGSLHAKTALLGDPNPTTSGRDTVMKYFKRIDELVSICVPSDTVRKSLDVERATYHNTNTHSGNYPGYSVMKSLILPRGGKIRLKFDVQSLNSSYPAKYAVFVNGSAVVGSTNCPTAYTTITLDLFVKDFDRIDVYVYAGYYTWSSCGYNYYAVYGGKLRNLKLCYDMADGAFVIND